MSRIKIGMFPEGAADFKPQVQGGVGVVFSEQPLSEATVTGSNPYTQASIYGQGLPVISTLFEIVGATVRKLKR